MDLYNNEIPVFIHHETHSDNAPSYWLDCLNQARKYNKQVFLCGNKIQKKAVGEIACFVDANSLVSPRWKEFKSVFRNYTTTYTDQYLDVIYKRLFMLYEFMSSHNMENCVLLDSDVLVYLNFSEYKDFHKHDVAFCVDYDQNFTKYGDSSELRMLANLGLSYWTINALDNFLKHCTNEYRNPSRLLKKYEFHKKHSLPGGVCEMSSAYLWIKDNPQFRFLNLAVEKDGFVFNSDYNFSRNYYNVEYKTNKITNFKKIKFSSNSPFPIFTTVDNRKISGYNIHFGGGSKRCMNDIYKNKKIGLYNYLIFFIIYLKRKLKK